MRSHDLVMNKTSPLTIKSRSENVRFRFNRLAFIQILRQRYDAYCRRAVLLDLLRYDDHMLDDMGHNRQDLLAIAKLPLSADADEALRQLRSDRNGKRIAC
ncbi:hypothetical protein [Amphritea sp.]|uniref:hypothetical protein n=1 Tax=Amphritea sp. TaxID=1872502 RepID=UPI003D0CC73A